MNQDRLSQRIVVDRAIGLIEVRSGDRLTMRELGAELGVEAMALYRYVSSKADLLDLVTATVIAEMDHLSHDQSQTWPDLLRHTTRQVHDQLLHHHPRHPTLRAAVHYRYPAAPPGVRRPRAWLITDYPGPAASPPATGLVSPAHLLTTAMGPATTVKLNRLHPNQRTTTIERGSRGLARHGQAYPGLDLAVGDVGLSTVDATDDHIVTPDPRPRPLSGDDVQTR